MKNSITKEYIKELIDLQYSGEMSEEEYDELINSFTKEEKAEMKKLMTLDEMIEYAAKNVTEYPQEIVVEVWNTEVTKLKKLK